MTHSQCTLCHAQSDIDWSLSNVKIAAQFGINEKSVRRHRKHLVEDTDPFFVDIPEAIITSRGQTIRLPDGSYQKVTYSPAKKALLDAFKYDDVERAIEQFHETPSTRSAKDVTFHLCLADLQVGKTDQNGGTVETVNKVLTALEKARRRALNEEPSTIVLWDLGDALEGIWNTAQQRATNDDYLTGQIRTVRRLFTEAIKKMAPLAPRVVFASVPSNHGQVRVGFGDKMGASVPHDDYGVDLNYSLEEIFAEREVFNHVEFLRPTGQYDESVYLELADGTKIAAVHGHQTKGSGKVGEWWKGQSHGRRNGLHMADILLAGHWHTFHVEHSGDGRWVIGAPSLDPGSAWFTNNTGESSKSGMLMFSTRNGQWEGLEIV